MVHDGMVTIQRNVIDSTKLGQRTASSLSGYIDQVSQNAYVKPYLTKADAIANSGLGHLEDRFPIVKAPTQQVIGERGSYYTQAVKGRMDGVLAWMVPKARAVVDTVLAPSNEGTTNGPERDAEKEPGQALLDVAITAYGRVMTRFHQVLVQRPPPVVETGKAVVWQVFAMVVALKNKVMGGDVGARVHASADQVRTAADEVIKAVKTDVIPPVQNGVQNARKRAQI